MPEICKLLKQDHHMIQTSGKHSHNGGVMFQLPAQPTDKPWLWMSSRNLVRFKFLSLDTYYITIYPLTIPINLQINTAFTRTALGCQTEFDPKLK
jgi:hypothetical protein